ncbi:MAG: GNAT family N-acetyltransferase [Pseudomonadota bacterium]
MTELRTPTIDLLPSYVDALQRDWSPDNVRGRAAAEEHLAAIAKDATAFIARQTDPDALGPPVILPDGSQVTRLPGRIFWIWDGDFCGSLGFRWQRGCADLPAHVLGHVGYSLVPWQRGRGVATRALRELLPHARALGLPFVEITTDPDNIASQKVITANGGILFETFTKPTAFGGAPGLRYRIPL